MYIIPKNKNGLSRVSVKNVEFCQKMLLLGGERPEKAKIERSAQERFCYLFA
jgi:hypothetical protein